MKEEYKNMVESVIGIFTEVDSRIKILLVRKKDEPYKNYWVLPSAILNNSETIEDSLNDIVINQIGLSDISFEHDNVFGSLDRDPDKRVIALSYISFIDSVSVELRKVDTDYEIDWFDIDSLPRLGYDHETIILSAINRLKKRIYDIDVLTKLFPSDFTLPEIQRIYEQVLETKFDRRNFRKKFIGLNLIEDTGDVTDGVGRPAKLYRFKDDISDGDDYNE